MIYDENYFAAQKKHGDIEGKAELFKFRQYVNPNDTVLDFGCGGGFTLKNIECRRRLGVDINFSARESASSMGIEVFETIDQVPADTVDVVLSNHALEHVNSPFNTLVALRKKIKPGSRVVFVVPHDCASQTWATSDHNKHLYTWNRMTLGNLFAAAGYAVEQVDLIRHRWPPRPRLFMKCLGPKLFQLSGYLVGWLTRTYQVRVVARSGNDTAN